MSAIEDFSSAALLEDEVIHPFVSALLHRALTHKMHLLQVLIFIDGEEKKSASLKEDFTPAIQPEEEIDDPEDKKPEDWVDIAKIPDPEAVKPDDWDEDAPLEIPDEVSA
jgi:hypothetical protein